MEKSLSSFSRDIADIFAEDSENDTTFYGFSDYEIGDVGESKTSYNDDAEVPKHRPAQKFAIRVALRSPSNDVQSDWPESDGEMEGNPKEGGKAFGLLPRLSDSDSEKESLLEKRALNIKANKAMLAQLMADLHKMPCALQKTLQADRPKGQHTRAPRSSAAACGVRRNPDRASRRQTRSMVNCQEPPVSQKDVELSLEEDLMEVRRAPCCRGNPRLNRCKPHTVKSVEEITEDELNLVADAMTDKVYNRAVGTTCHQCRQKTMDTKTYCRSAHCHGIQGQFCGPCLRNRYGEDVRKALLDPEWRCPPCRGICNCSFCRQRDGRCPTGILFPLAQYHGFSDVHSYLSSLQHKLKKEEDV